MDNDFIFISYKREDAAIAVKVRFALEANGFKVWFDEDVQCGQKWVSILDDRLTNAKSVVVLWSIKANGSPWVKHEASHAMTRGVYAPCRIQLVEIDPPYNQIQATDLLGWDGEEEHPGFQRLVYRINELMPEEMTLSKRTLTWTNKNKTMLLAILFAISAMLILGWQTLASMEQLLHMNTMISQQATSARDIERAVHPIENFKVESFIDVLPGNKEIDEYLKNVSQSVNTILSSSDSINVNGVWVVSESIREDGKKHIDTIGFSLKSDLAPKSKKVFDLLWISIYSIGMLSSPVDPTIFSKVSNIKVPSPDFKFLIYTDLQYLWDVNNEQLTIFLKMASDEGSWSRTGNIVSVPDLKRSQLFIKLADRAGQTITHSKSQSTLRAQDNLKLRSITLSMSGGRRFLIKETDVTHHKSEDGIGYYSMDPMNWSTVESRL